MKNLFILVAFTTFIFSCGKSEFSNNNNQNCEGTNGSVTGSIDGVSINSTCNVGTLTVLQSTDFFITGSSSFYQTVGQERFNGFILTITSNTGIQEECITRTDSSFLSNITNSQTSFGLVYYDDVNLLNADSEDEGESVFYINSESNIELCIVEFDRSSGILEGYFSGRLFNELGEYKDVTNGSFSFDMD